ncbi:hypothetical protein BV25DRAFT_1880195 [Artomyces pyxidatus]|uniref:Uncharacterized protein n=1 Tax=Artomyces pyxidatus TaxID=48021 RepID=A0ACB8T993_9AGAM|nr:hypothetical protein BV25DRAFT_1880195 [Artomyces pyxidatus]
MSSSHLPLGLKPSSPETTALKLASIAQKGRAVIAVDLDDVLSQTSRCAAEWHNRRFATDMQISTFYYSMWYKNPGWGTVPQTLEKVKEFYDTDQLRNAIPVPGALDGVRALRNLGFELVIVTARIINAEYESTMRWLQCHFEDLFDCVVFSAQSQESLSDDESYVGTRLTKLQVCAASHAIVLVDDLLETALVVARQGRLPVLLFGDYEWNQRVDAGDKWGFEEKLQAEGGRKWWLEDTVELQDDMIWRVRGWDEVAAWVVANFVRTA